MANVVVVGSQWGDEGKGKIVDILAHDADVIVRFQGGSNAGHTVVTKKGTYVFHLMPSGILSRGKLGILGNGVAIDPGALIQELDFLQTKPRFLSRQHLSSQLLRRRIERTRVDGVGAEHLFHFSQNVLVVT